MAEEKALRNYMQVCISSPNGIIYDHRSVSCNVVTVDGGLTIMPNHIPILAALDVGPVKVTRLADGNPVDYIAINGGILSMSNNRLEIISNYAVRARDINEAEVEIQKQQAEEDMEAALREHDARAFRRAKISLNRAINMISVSKHRRS
ncbi:ATP synthase F1 subunit epsilon [Aerococcaceae bacterium zg-B36]|uniref:ATP synthase F1 subunit epsilon n=1 Tax=Aerococcaceae bacterium zg-252 TaxID=2796928 RepID=UPI001BD8CEB4|nr:ATP synthase F1 subunit epsilon [Aerococcaceae bacterium zg-B36]